jgi:3-isopropylmalate dehydrogenase
MFSDILTDEASMLAGSLGLLPSASPRRFAPGTLYEPVSRFSADGTGKASPAE